MTEDNKNFFKAKVFIVLAKELRRRYYLKEDYGISVGRKVFSDVDTEPLRSLMGINPVDWAKTSRLSISKFEAALKDSIFSWEIKDFVVFVTKEPLLFKGEVAAEKQKRFLVFCQTIHDIDPVFLSKMSENQLLHWFEKGDDSFIAFRQVSKALKNLPKEYTRMPVFAYQQTGDAHSYDEGRAAGQLLIQMLETLSKPPAIAAPLARTEIKHQLLADFCLLRDDIMNDVAIRGLESKIDGRINQMWKQGCLESCSWNVPLKEILRMDEIYPHNGEKVLVVENSGVYSILVDLLPDLPIICSSGQFTYAVWQLLRKLQQSNSQLYYVGDLDPEGLVMAQRLLEVFPDNVKLIAMNHGNFCLAAQPSEITASRLKQLRVIKEPALKKVANLIIETEKVAYQEGFIGELLEELGQEFQRGIGNGHF